MPHHDHGHSVGCAAPQKPQGCSQTLADHQERQTSRTEPSETCINQSTHRENEPASRCVMQLKGELKFLNEGFILFNELHNNFLCPLLHCCRDGSLCLYASIVLSFALHHLFSKEACSGLKHMKEKRKLAKVGKVFQHEAK